MRRSRTPDDPPNRPLRRAPDSRRGGSNTALATKGTDDVRGGSEPSAEREHGIAITRVRLFGSLSVEIGGLKLGVRDLGGVKPKQLFEILLLARGGHVSKDRLADLLWGEDMPENVAGTLGTYISVLRARLDLAAARPRDGLIATDHGSYRVRTDALWTDLDELDAVLDRWRVPAIRALAPLEQALTLVRGELLEDEPYAGWVLGDRDRYRARRATLLRRLAATQMLVGRFDEAVDQAEHAMTLEPMDEAACRLLMVASYGAGRQHAAFRAFESCRRLLDEELGVQPMDETSEILTRIRRQEPIASMLARLVRAPVVSR